jgi:hypothetical protein
MVLSRKKARNKQVGKNALQNAIRFEKEAFQAANRFDFNKAIEKGELALENAEIIGLSRIEEAMPQNINYWRSQIPKKQKIKSSKREIGITTRYKKKISSFKKKVPSERYSGFAPESKLHEVLRDIINVVKHFIREKSGEKLPPADKITPKQVLYSRGPSFLYQIALKLREKIDALHTMLFSIDKATIEKSLQRQLKRELTKEEKEMGVTEINALFLRKEVKMHLYDSRFVNFMENFEKKREKILDDLDEIRDYWKEIVKLRGEVPKSSWWRKNRFEKLNDMSIVYPFSQEILLMLKTFDLIHAQFLIELDPVRMITDLVRSSEESRTREEKIKYLRQAERIAKKAKMEERREKIQEKIEELELIR